MSQSPRFKSWPGSIIFPLILQKVVYSLVANTEEFSLKKIFIQKIVFPIVHTLNISASDTAYKYLLTAFSPAWYMSIYSRKSSSNKLKVISNFSLLHKLDLRQHAVGKNYLDVCVCVSCVLRQWSFIICVHACTHACMCSFCCSHAKPSNHCGTHTSNHNNPSRMKRCLQKLHISARQYCR